MYLLCYVLLISIIIVSLLYCARSVMEEPFINSIANTTKNLYKHTNKLKRKTRHLKESFIKNTVRPIQLKFK